MSQRAPQRKKKNALWALGGLLACCGGGTVLGVIIGPSDADVAPAPAPTTAAPATPNTVAELPSGAASTPDDDDDAAARTAEADRQAEADRKVAAERKAAATRKAQAVERQKAETQRKRLAQQRREAAEQREAEQREGEQAEREEPASAYYANCSEARDAGVTPLRRGDPGYRVGLDRDKDGDACE